MAEALGLTRNERETIEHIMCQMEEERGLDRRAAMADMRFTFIRRVCRQTVLKPKETKERRRSRRIDSILTGRWTAIPSFLLIMALVFYLTFNTVGLWLQELFETAIDWFTAATAAALERWDIAPAVRSLVVDGICGPATWAAIELAKRPEFEGKTIAVLLPDTGDRYLSTSLFGED